jgi:hypothetical protein
MMSRPSRQRPLWRRGFDTVERAAAPHLERAVQSDGFVSAVGAVVRVRRLIGGTVEAASTRVLHALNLPTYSDVKKDARRTAEIEHRLRELDRAPRGAADTRPRKR